MISFLCSQGPAGTFPTGANATRIGSKRNLFALSHGEELCAPHKLCERGPSGHAGSATLAKLSWNGTVVTDGLTALSKQLRGVMHGCFHFGVATVHTPMPGGNWGEGAFPLRLQRVLGAFFEKRGWWLLGEC